MRRPGNRFCSRCYEEGLLVSLGSECPVVGCVGRPGLPGADPAYALPGPSAEAERRRSRGPVPRPRTSALAALRAVTSARLIVLTKGADGARAWLDDARNRGASRARPSLADTVGAGDTFTATLLAGLAEAGALSPDGLAALTRDRRPRSCTAPSPPPRSTARARAATRQHVPNSTRRSQERPNPLWTF